MAEYIEREAVECILNQRLSNLRSAYGDYDAYTDGFDECVDRVTDFPAADVAPVGELVALRNELYDCDEISMKGLRKLNTLISKYKRGEEDATD